MRGFVGILAAQGQIVIKSLGTFNRENGLLAFGQGYIPGGFFLFGYNLRRTMVSALLAGMAEAVNTGVYGMGRFKRQVC